MRYYIVDDDSASRMMLKKIIVDGELGLVIGEAENGEKSIAPILSTLPDIVLIDFLMPDLDGIETIEKLKSQGFEGQFIMISQIVNKEMVGEAYKKGIEFFIHKPINKVEVQTILQKTAEQYRLRDSLLTIKESLASFTTAKPALKKQNVGEIVRTKLSDMGIMSEVGSNDLKEIIEMLVYKNNEPNTFPPLIDIYESLAKRQNAEDIKKEMKAIEQRLRRTILAAIQHIATIGSIDYTSREFEHYAPRYFEYQEIRKLMIEVGENRLNSSKIKVNIKKFIQVLYLEVLESYKNI
ncbi:two-component system, response regulator YcbB [Psychrobacillus sp. OK028]|uniref:response regulator n=1 Tax=Psychrobacillus sp. OK028 TaxID=1884359 RepID=UPI00088E45DA|nr:response regulator [Psychrobacillus sp. OK028]SDN87503.1 two-component system, response regulator YcbB [Psychrobacillus sp. OK028]